MSNNKSPSSSSERSRRVPVYGMVTFGILAILGLLWWLSQVNTSSKVVTIAAPTHIPSIASPTSITTPLPVVVLVSTGEPVTLTPIPTDTAALIYTATPTNTATTTHSSTTSPKATHLPPTVTEMATLSPESTSGTNPTQPAAPTPTREPWPTTNPTLLVRPPTDMDSGQNHLWFGRPIDGNNIPSAPYRFGMTYDQRLVPHRAVDIANNLGTPVVAVGPGTVFYAGEDVEVLFGPQPDFYGRLVVIEMDQKWQGRTVYALYGHLESVAVTSGQIVSPGDVVGAVGNSGVALDSHLHFEIRQDAPYDYASVRNPELWYWPFNGRGVLAGRVIDASGDFMPGTRVNLQCSDAAARYVETYWDQYTPPDDVLAENFAISDLPAGICRIWADLMGTMVEKHVEIRPNDLATVVLEEPG